MLSSNYLVFLMLITIYFEILWILDVEFANLVNLYLYWANFNSLLLEFSSSRLETFDCSTVWWFILAIFFISRSHPEEELIEKFIFLFSVPICINLVHNLQNLLNYSYKIWNLSFFSKLYYIWFICNKCIKIHLNHASKFLSKHLFLLFSVKPNHSFK